MPIVAFVIDADFTGLLLQGLALLGGISLLIATGIAARYGVRWWKQCVQAGYPPQYRLKELFLFIMMLTPALAGVGNATDDAIRILLGMLAASMAIGGVLGWLHICRLRIPQRPSTSDVVISMLAGALVFPFLVCLAGIAVAVGLMAFFSFL